ncbi:hypothetical protein [Hymenobacter tenuis]
MNIYNLSNPHIVRRALCLGLVVLLPFPMAAASIIKAPFSSVLITSGAILLLAVLVLTIDRWLAPGRLVCTSYEGARNTLDRLADWAKWMAGIQTATLGGIGLIIKDRRGAEQEEAVVAAILVLGAALFCSAWILSSLASIELRISAVSINAPKMDTAYDVYELPMYGFTKISLSYMLSLQHWLWAAGLLCFTWFLLELHNYPNTPNEKNHQSSGRTMLFPTNPGTPK